MDGVIETGPWSQLQVQKIVEVPQIEYEDQVVEIPQIKHVHVPWHPKGKLVLGRSIRDFGVGMQSLKLGILSFYQDDCYFMTFYAIWEFPTVQGTGKEA